jgi:hypothetical protein
MSELFTVFKKTKTKKILFARVSSKSKCQILTPSKLQGTHPVRMQIREEKDGVKNGMLKATSSDAGVSGDSDIQD